MPLFNDSFHRLHLNITLMVKTWSLQLPGQSASGVVVLSTSVSWLFGCFGWQAGEDGDEPGGHRNYICPALQTGLCDWSAKYFAQPVMKVASQCSAFHSATQPSLAFWFFCLSCLCESHVRPFVLCVLLLLFYQWVNRLCVRGWAQQSFARWVFALIKHSIHVFFFKSRVKKEQIHTSVLIIYSQCFINNPPQK